ncbi:MAG: right-handed parallel beta-helix repeat-containing protein, partial [Hadesarchaea archaeon]|nr:right-handed parallel beta-helix repeat-containing protein [Hadesarchaea archaeon]
IETWSGAIKAPIKWQLIEEWTGTISAPAMWDLIESWTGAVEAPVAWQIIETWTGAIEAGLAQWDLIETWTGTVQASATWQIIETWIGTVQAPIEWQIVETWTGTIGALAEWQLIETWTGTVEAPAEWQLIETWTGTVEAPAVWQLIETWTETIEAPVGWQLIETWTGTVKAPAEWQLIETWTGAIEVEIAQWNLIETWTGTIQSPATWQIIETWIGTVQAPIEWQIVETWTGTIGAPAGWNLIETWTGVIEASAEWRLVEAWTGVVEAPAAWQLIETWSGAIESPVKWQLIEEWMGTVSAPAVWDLIESWTGAVEAPVAWQLIETWTGAVEAPAAWQLIETWSRAIESPVGWQLIEEWMGTISAPAVWDLIESWTGAVEAPVAWQLIETWTGTVEAPAAWQLVETWTGPIEAPAAWQLIETWTSTIEVPAAWQLIETWTSTIEAPAAWQLIDTWTGVIEGPVYPSKPTLYLPADGSITNDNMPYFEWTLGTNADNHHLLVDNDPDFISPEENVLLGATDNTYTPTAELADENYSWKVIAINAFGENESTVWTFTIDTTAPAAPSPLEPADGSLTNDNTPTFRWTEVTDPSGVTYTIQVDNDSDFTSPEVNVLGLTENTYMPSALADENYSWRVRAVDGANNVGAWSNIWTLLVDTTPPPQVTLISPSDGTMTNDNTPTFTWNSLSDPSGLTYTIQVDNDSDFTSPEVSVSGLTENTYTPSALADENYSWRVRAVDGAGNSGDWSTVWTLLIDTTAPAAPSPLEPADGSLMNDNTPTLRWTEVIDASGVTYTIQVDNDSDFSSPEVNVSGLNENSYTPSALADENYSWRVRAVDGANNVSDWSTTWTFVIDTVPPSTPALQSPADGAITNDNTPTFDWFDVAGAENYDLLVDNDADFSSPEIQVTVPISTRTPTAGLPDENYSWKVRARDAANNVSDYSSTWTLLIDTVPPDIPTLQSPADGTITNDNTPTFDWSDVADAVEYRLQVDNDPDFSSFEINVLVASSTYTPMAELADENYSWRVQARDSVNNWSPWSSVWTLVVAVRVRAVDVSVSPSWKENIPGGFLSYVVVVTNLGEVADDLNLSASDALGWGLSLDNTRFEDVENGGSRSTTLRVTIPSTAVPSQTDNITVTVTSEGDPSKSDSENCQAHVTLLRDVEVEISPSWREGSPDETLLYVVTVKNTGHLNDKYNLTASDNLGWALEISPTELWIENGDNDIASLSVTIPLETVSSITDVITVRAEGTLAQGTPTDPENVSAENTAEARCTVVRVVNVSISPSYQSGMPGTLLTYTVTVTNTGNALDTYELTTSDNAGWSPVVSPSSMGLSPSASGNVTLKVIVPFDAIGSTRDNIIVTATSQLDNTVSGSASCIAQAFTITIHGPIHIVGNDNFTEANGVISGSGTLEDPYIIGYWDINAENTHGIWIESTDVYFIIRSCRTHDGGYGYNYGVYFDHVENGKIEGATSYFNDVGIYLKNSPNNIISESNASYNVNGIYLQFSSNNIIEKCTASNNFSHGIHLESSDNNIISESNASNNTNGIYLQSSSNNIIEKSNTFNNGLYGICIRSSSENNTVSNSDSYNNTRSIYISNLSDNNHIHHNSFENNLLPAWDECSNRWDNGYPSGGNYWNDYTGADNYRGENQDMPGSDGIGDTPYYIYGDNNRDRYPLVIRRFELSISPYYEEGMPGAKLSYTVTLTNMGNIADNYSLTVSDNAGWSPTITPSSLSVYPDTSENAILEVTIPENADNSNRDNIRVVARSQTDNTVSVESSCIAHAVIRGVIVSISPGYLGASPGVELVYTVTVTNIGLADDTYNLSATDNSGWGPSVSPTSLSVLVGENETATLSVTIPENAIPSEEDNIIVFAISQENPNVGDNDSCMARASIGRDVEVLISPRENGELARENVTFTVKITNTGNVADNYDLAVIDNLGWAPTLSENSIENVQPSENRSVLLSVAIPENAEPGTEDNITVIAISRANPEVSDNDSCIAHVVSPKAEFNLTTLYEVCLDLDLYLSEGSKLVVKFYTYGDAYENENVIETFTTPPPWRVEENKSARHPEGIGVKKARLDLTTDDTENVISTIASFTVTRNDLFGRIMGIKGEWPLPGSDRNALFQEIMDIKGLWPIV